MIISIAIVDSNREYLKRLTEVLQEYGELRISIFTNVEKLLDSMRREKYDVVLFDPDVSDEKLYISNVKLLLCLYSDEAENKDLYKDIDNIHKYQRISNIYKEILKKYADKAGYLVGAGGIANTKLISVYSPSGGVGKTVVSLALSVGLAELGKKVLYISNEQLSSSSSILPYKEQGTTALVEAMNSGASFEVKLKGIVKEGMDGIEYFEGFERIADYGDVDKAEMKSLLENIRRSGLYDYVVIDMESNIDETVKATWDEVDNIIVICKSGEFSSRKLELFSAQGVVLENRHKFLRVHNMSEGSWKFNDELDVPCIGNIHNYGNIGESHIIKGINYNKEIDLNKIL